jgi:hypothetical protein
MHFLFMASWVRRGTVVVAGVLPAVNAREEIAPAAICSRRAASTAAQTSAAQEDVIIGVPPLVFV